MYKASSLKPASFEASSKLKRAVLKLLAARMGRGMGRDPTGARGPPCRSERPSR